MLSVAGISRKSTSRLRYRMGAGGSAYVLNSVTINVEPGETFAVVGRTGSGKSTLARIVCGLLLADGGTVSVNGRVMSPGGTGIVRLASGVIGGSASYSPLLTVDENLNMAGSMLGMSAEDAAARATELVDVLGLSRERVTVARKLRRGAKRRLELGIALVAAPPVLVLDEPFAGLDGDEAGALAHTLRVIGDRHAILLLTASEDVAAAMSRQAAILEAGRIVKQGRTYDLFRDRSLIRYGVTLSHRSLVGLNRFLDELALCFGKPEVKRQGLRAVVTIRDRDPRLVYGVIALARDCGCVLMDVSRPRRSLWADTGVESGREGRRPWSF